MAKEAYNCSNWFGNQAKAINHGFEQENISKAQVGLQKFVSLWFSHLGWAIAPYLTTKLNSVNTRF